MNYYIMKLLLFSILSQLLYYVNSDNLIFLIDYEFNNSCNYNLFMNFTNNSVNNSLCGLNSTVFSNNSLCDLNSTGFINNSLCGLNSTVFSNNSLNSLCELNSTGFINNSLNSLCDLNSTGFTNNTFLLITGDYSINSHLNCYYSLEYDIFNVSYLCNLISNLTNTSLEQHNLNYFIFNLENILIISVSVIMCLMTIFAIVLLGCNRPPNIIDNDIKNDIENDAENDFYNYKQPGIIHNNLYNPLNIQGVGYIEVNNDDTYSLDDHEDAKESYNYLKDVYNMSTDF